MSIPRFAFWCFLRLLPVLGVPSSPPPIIKIDQGQVQGKWMPTRGGRSVAGFIGLPYAIPPLGDLRFESPRPGASWKNVYHATYDKPGCIQRKGPPFIPGSTPSNISEDCLYLNVYTPELKPKKNLPVLVFLPGGSFESCTAESSTYGPDYLLDEDIILVTVSYRVGILGFLSLDHPVMPGNLGLKDQRLALRWVKNNAVHFGGDPKQVTISGQSAGAISVYYHLIFTANEGLFRAAIAESGSSRTILGVQVPHPQRPVVKKLVKITGCPEDPFELTKCLKLLHASEFPKILEKLRETELPVKFRKPILTPVIEPSSVKDAVITTNPFNTTTATPILQGANQMEGLSFIVEFEMDKSDTLLKMLNEHYKTVLPYDFYFEDTAKSPEKVVELIKQFYFGKGNIDRQHLTKLSQMVADCFINYPIVDAARTNKEKTFFYQMNYRGSNTIVHYSGSKEYMGVTHSDELFYLFSLGGPGIRNVTEQDTKFSKTFVNLWTNFVKHVNPTPTGHPVKWDSISTPSIEFLNIGQTNFTMDKDFLKPRIDFWTTLPYRYTFQPGRAHS